MPLPLVGLVVAAGLVAKVAGSIWVYRRWQQAQQRARSPEMALLLGPQGQDAGARQIFIHEFDFSEVAGAELREVLHQRGIPVHAIEAIEADAWEGWRTYLSAQVRHPKPVGQPSELVHLARLAFERCEGKAMFAHLAFGGRLPSPALPVYPRHRDPALLALVELLGFPTVAPALFTVDAHLPDGRPWTKSEWDALVQPWA